MPLSINAAEFASRLHEKRLARGLSLRQAALEAGVSLEQVANTPADHDVVTHGPGESTVEAVALHLRADKDLDPKDAQILMDVFRVAYENLRKRHGNE